MYSEFIEQAESVEDLKHDCLAHLELRARDKGTGMAYAKQCILCGEAKGGEVSKKKITTIPPPFDNDLPKAYGEQRKALLDKELDTLRASKSIALGESPAVPVRETLLNKVEAMLAELKEEYPSVDATLAFQSYLTRQREITVNASVSRWKSEAELSSWFKQQFTEWFEIEEEVWGTGYVNREKRRVRIDFIIKAKPALVDLGFTDQYVGVEIKFFSALSGHGFHGKSSRGIFQALSYWYSGAAWEVTGEVPQSLATVLVFSNLSFLDEREKLFKTYDGHYRALWRSYFSIANHSNVGELKVSDNGRSGLWWAMDYVGTNYFSRRSNGQLVLGNPNVINKVRIGNRQRKK